MMMPWQWMQFFMPPQPPQHSPPPPPPIIYFVPTPCPPQKQGWDIQFKKPDVTA